MRENREHGRAPIELKVDYKKLTSFFADYRKNISKGGTFIKTKKTLPLGTRFLFRLTVPGRDRPFELNGEVIHAPATGEERRPRDPGAAAAREGERGVEEAERHDSR